jgi:5-methylcytosine-specific restriction endonuclease McrA
MNSTLEFEFPEPAPSEENVPAYIIRKRAKNREYWAANKERLRPIQRKNQRRRYIETRGNLDIRAYALAHGSITRAKKLKLLCACCSIDQFIAVYREAVNQRAEVDHIIAYCNGGKHCSKNLQILSVEDHKEKTRRDLEEMVPHRLVKKRKPVIRDLFS